MVEETQLFTSSLGFMDLNLISLIEDTFKRIPTYFKFLQTGFFTEALKHGATQWMSKTHQPFISTFLLQVKNESKGVMCWV